MLEDRLVGEADPDVRAVQVVRVAVGDRLGADRVPVQVAEVVAVEVAVGGRLPVAARQLRLDVVAMELVELQHLQRRLHVAQPSVDVELGPDGERSRTRRRRVQPSGTRRGPRRRRRRTPPCPGSPTSLPGGVVDPRVVGARHPAAVAEAVLGDRPAAVPAGVEERAGNAVVAADHDDRPVGDLHRREVPGVRDVDRQGHHQRAAPEHGLDLALEPRRDRGTRSAGIFIIDVGEIAAVGVDVGQQAPGQIGQRRRRHAAPLLAVSRLRTLPQL